jgi:hypothetical protein
MSLLKNAAWTLMYRIFTTENTEIHGMKEESEVTCKDLTPSSKYSVKRQDFSTLPLP